MTENHSKGKLVRLQDFIRHGRAGKKVSANVELRKPFVRQQVHPDETEDRRHEISMCLLTGDFIFDFEGEEYTISKVYVATCTEWSMEIAQVDKHIANERLKMDYKRLRDANIALEEKFFE